MSTPFPTLFRGAPVRPTRVRLSDAAQRAFERDLGGQLDALMASADVLLGDVRSLSRAVQRVVPRADGGLWLILGHEGLSAIFGVAAGAWAPVSPWTPSGAWSPTHSVAAQHWH